MAMMDYPYPTEFLMPLPGNPVKAVCKAIIGSDGGNAPKGSPKATLRKVFAGLSVYFNHTGESKCLDFREANPPTLGADMWDYQVQLGFIFCFLFQGSPSAWTTRIRTRSGLTCGTIRYTFYRCLFSQNRLQ